MGVLIMLLTIILIGIVSSLSWNSRWMQAWLELCVACPGLPYITGGIVAAILIALFELTGIIDW